MKPIYLYHLSYSPNLKVMKPKVQTGIEHEPKDKRICFSKSIIGCFCAVSLIDFFDHIKPFRKYLYRTKDKVLYERPYGVEDSRLTKEVWRVENTEVVKVGSFCEDWLLAIPCVSRGGRNKDAKLEQRRDIRVIRRIFEKTEIPFNIACGKRKIYDSFSLSFYAEEM